MEDSSECFAVLQMVALSMAADQPLVVFDNLPQAAVVLIVDWTSLRAWEVVPMPVPHLALLVGQKLVRAKEGLPYCAANFTEAGYKMGKTNVEK